MQPELVLSAIGVTVGVLVLLGSFSKYYLTKINDVKIDSDNKIIAAKNEIDNQIKEVKELCSHERIYKITNDIFDAREKVVWRELEHSDNNIKSLEKKFDSFSKDMGDKLDKLYDKLDAIYKDNQHGK